MLPLAKTPPPARPGPPQSQDSGQPIRGVEEGAHLTLASMRVHLCRRAERHELQMREKTAVGSHVGSVRTSPTTRVLARGRLGCALGRQVTPFPARSSGCRTLASCLWSSPSSTPSDRRPGVHLACAAFHRLCRGPTIGSASRPTLLAPMARPPVSIGDAGGPPDAMPCAPNMRYLRTTQRHLARV